jgi:hypothetical protein
MSLEAIKSKLNPAIGSMKKITLKYSGALRGTEPTVNVTSGIYIKRNGIAMAGSIGENATITIEGGTSQWEGALKADYAGTYISVAQERTLWSIIDYIESLNKNVELIH